MLGVNVTAHAMPHIGPAPPAQPQGAIEPRAVESTERGTVRTGSHDVLYTPSQAVLRLLRTSAQHFAEVLELTKDATVAGSMSGFNVEGSNQHVDTYA